jgi:hypothetical protein
MHQLFLYGATSLDGQDLLSTEASRSHSDTPHSVGLFGRVIRPTQRHLLDNTQHSKKRDIHAPRGIRTHNLSKRAAADPHLRPRGHWDLHASTTITYKVDSKKHLFASLLSVSLTQVSCGS